MPSFYEYTKVNYTCQFCGWQGTGEEAEQDEMFDYGFQIVCPKCFSINPDKSKDRVSKPQYPDYIPYPEFGEILTMGTDEDKAAVLPELRLSEAINLESIGIDNLPEINKEQLFFKIVKKEVEGKGCIVVYESNNLFLILKIAKNFEQQLIEIEKLLNEKYGNKLKDLVFPYNS